MGGGADYNKERGPRREKNSQHFFFLSAGTGYETSGHNRMVINT